MPDILMKIVINNRYGSQGPVTGLLTGLLLSLSAITVNAEDIHRNDYEQSLIQSLDDLSQQRIEPAFERIEQLVEDNPKFRLAQLIYADLLLAKAQPLTEFGAHPEVQTKAPKAKLQGLRDEARKRWQHYSNPKQTGTIPASMIHLDEETNHAVLIDLDNSRLYIFKNNSGIPELVEDYYVSIGKRGADKLVQGDKKTPIGVYAITRFISDKKLPEFYGSGAFPIDYPNRWDRRLGKTGYGIWLHGTPVDTYSRPPLASDGCVAISNDEFTQLRPYVEIRKTPVVITQGINWIPRAEWLHRQENFTALLDSWEKDWESRNSKAYLAHYSKKDFKSGNYSYSRWAKHKSRVNAAKEYIRVKRSAVNIFVYPGVENMLEVTFEQHYQSNNYNNSNHKRQYWKKESDGRWRIIYEGPA